MPRKKIRFEEQRRPTGGDLADRLADELQNSRASGQPIIEEQEFPTGTIRVIVIWDSWDDLSMEDRTAVILKAYEVAEGRELRDKIALASGMTVPEAHAAGMLPFEIIPALRKGDAVTLDECHNAMIEEGASTLLNSERPQLRFSSADDAEAARKRLIQRLPDSEPVWVITQDVGKVAEWAQR